MSRKSFGVCPSHRRWTGGGPPCLRGAALSLALWSAGCGGSEKPPEEPEELAGGIVHGADLSRCEYKGRKDRVFTMTRAPGARTHNVYRIYDVSLDVDNGRRVLRCRQADTNLDGIRDVIRTYTDDGKPLDEQSDTDYDGRIDTWVRFSRGQVLRESHDRNRDGKADEFRIYSDGRLSRLQRDSDHNGKLDTWEVYDGGRLHRIGVDVNGDERVDRWYRDAELKRQEEQDAETEEAAGQPPAPEVAGLPEAEAEAKKSSKPPSGESADQEAAGPAAPPAAQRRGPDGTDAN